MIGYRIFFLHVIIYHGASCSQGWRVWGWSWGSPSIYFNSNISVKLPVFWPDAAEVCFPQAEAQFAIRNITVSKIKFYHRVAVPPQEVASQLSFWTSSVLLLTWIPTRPWRIGVSPCILWTNINVLRLWFPFLSPMIRSLHTRWKGC